MLNRDELAAWLRGACYVLAGAALLCAIGSWLGWWATCVIAISCIGVASWDAWLDPRWWRLWR